MITGTSPPNKGELVSNILTTILGTLFIFAMTTLGSASVFLFRKGVGDKLNSLFLGLSSGVMIAASVWSLLLPALSQAEEGGWGEISFLPVAIGLVVGSLFLILIEKICAFIQKERHREFSSISTIKKSTKLFLAVTVHNIPEGLSVGLAFGNAFVTGGENAFVLALALAIGIGVQNLPEGAAISLPMAKELGSKWKAFGCGVASGAVEPVMAVIGILLSTILTPIMPWLLAFSAGAMIYVVIEELLPEGKEKTNSKISTWGFIAGFVIMMILDVALG